MTTDLLTPEAASTTASGRAYDFAKWAILSGVHPTGFVVTDAALTHETGLSRSPVHAALLCLRPKGWSHCSRVVGAGEHLFVVRGEGRDGGAGPGGEPHHGPQLRARATLLPQVEAPHAAMEKDERSQDTVVLTASGRLFHEPIVGAAGNAVLSSIDGTPRERPTLFTSAVLRGRANRMQATTDEHAGIIETWGGDDRKAFGAAVDDHLQRSIALAGEST